MSLDLLIASNRKIFAIFLECVVLVLISLCAVAEPVEATDSDGYTRAAAQKQPPSNPKADFFVAVKGNDSWSGTLPAPNSSHNDGPFASIARAQIAVQKLIQAHPNRPIIVMIRGERTFCR